MLEAIDKFGDKYLAIEMTPRKDSILFRLSHFADHSIIWFVAGLIRFAFTRDVKDLARFVAVMAVESALTNGPIRYWFRRKRPQEKESTYVTGERLP